ncbi:hypothetical protein IMZ48_29165 [Candidatus Bathyarchaeota archaeon]|nr:hypothetical protein [Candidatus Bathyarchaeota archaeon]
MDCSELSEPHTPGGTPPPCAPLETTAAAEDLEDLELLRPFTSSPTSDLSRSYSSSSSMAGDDASGASEPLSTGPFNFQTQVLSTSPVKSVCYPCGSIPFSPATNTSR